MSDKDTDRKPYSYQGLDLRRIGAKNERNLPSSHLAPLTKYSRNETGELAEDKKTYGRNHHERDSQVQYLQSQIFGSVEQHAQADQKR